MRENCVRMVDVEPWLDKRLSPADERRVVEHVAECVDCARERASLESLRADLGAIERTPNAFTMKRLRRELLQRIEGTEPPRPAKRLAPRLYAFIGAAAVTIAAVLAIAFWQAGPSSADVKVSAAAGASFARERNGSDDVVRLNEGSFAFDVNAHAEGRRLIFIVPDGEIEDIGTKFMVVVRDGHTEQIAVTEGEVEFRRRDGSPPLRLIAGMTYRRLDAETQKSEPSRSSAVQESHQSAEPPEPPAPKASAVATTVRAPPHAATSAQSIAAERARTAGSAAPPGPNAVEARGTPTAAPVATAAPSSLPMETGLAAEDIAYMDVVRLVRAGKTAEARHAARRWLTQYPGGLRKFEVERVAHGATP